MSKEEKLNSLVKKKLEDLNKNELIKEVKQLREQNKSLKDEKESLWMMLDEISESDIENWAYLLDQLEAKVGESTLIRGLPTDKAIKKD
jgi:nucleotidyltransferase/DNA polymerase involved in DNA repair|tara:strand:- start:8551 stop:8817 length:267 start_codon:yes stop_codon:yes gene_type:complete